MCVCVCLDVCSEGPEQNYILFNRKYIPSLLSQSFAPICVWWVRFIVSIEANIMYNIHLYTRTAIPWLLLAASLFLESAKHVHSLYVFCVCVVCTFFLYSHSAFSFSVSLFNNEDGIGLSMPFTHMFRIVCLKWHHINNFRPYMSSSDFKRLIKTRVGVWMLVRMSIQCHELLIEKWGPRPNH